MASNFEKFSDESRKIDSQKPVDKGVTKLGLSATALCRVVGMSIGALLFFFVWF